MSLVLTQQQLTCTKGHVLESTTHEVGRGKRFKYCDAPGCQKPKFDHGDTRFFCDEGCDYDVCSRCAGYPCVVQCGVPAPSSDPVSDPATSDTEGETMPDAPQPSPPSTLAASRGPTAQIAMFFECCPD